MRNCKRILENLPKKKFKRKKKGEIRILIEIIVVFQQPCSEFIQLGLIEVSYHLPNKKKYISRQVVHIHKNLQLNCQNNTTLCMYVCMYKSIKFRKHYNISGRIVRTDCNNGVYLELKDQ